MQVATKVVFNTIVLYTRIIITMAISLVSVPLVLGALGASDYGLYNVVAGVVGMLSFLNNSMMVSTQRFVSVAMGTGNVNQIDKIYNASFKIHLILGIAVVLLLEVGALFIGKLNIDPDRMEVAHILYQFLVFATFVRIINVPFGALISAHEDMLVTSIIIIIDSLFMLAIAYFLRYVTIDKLLFYGLGVAIVPVISFLMIYTWTRYAYKDFRVKLNKYKNGHLMKEMASFAGWNLFGGLAVMGRNQGVAVIINLFLGTIANAAYGVANQINGAMLNFSSTFQKALNPQLMKSEGMNNRDRLHRISFISSKFSVLAMCLFAIPLIIEMPEVLRLWLHGNIPPFTLRLSQFILLFSIVYQYSSGIMSSIQATGNIRNYQITMGLIILLNVPLSFLILKMGLPVYYITGGYVLIEIVSLIVRIFMARKITGMVIADYITNVIRPTVLVVGFSTLVCLVPYFLLPEGFVRLCLVSVVYGISYLFLVWLFAFDIQQRSTIKDFVDNKILKKTRKNH